MDWRKLGERVNRGISMVTKQELLDYIEKRQALKMWLTQKCREQDSVRTSPVAPRDPYCSDFGVDYVRFELWGGNRIVVYFEKKSFVSSEKYKRILPLDIVFDDNYQAKQRARFEEEKQLREALEAEEEAEELR